MSESNQSLIVSIKNFSMTFGVHKVIDNLSFDINRGETFGLLGSNGSGKTTIIRALLNMYRPTDGSLLIDGKAYTASRAKLLGYLPEERGLYKKERVLDTMVYFGRLKGASKSVATTWAVEYLKRVGLESFTRSRLGTLSGGMQQKVQLGVAIMGDPKLLILDEPTKGFDPVNRRLLMDIIEEHHKRGATVIFVTHQMEEVERLCDRVILLKDGTSRLYGTIDDIKRQYSLETTHALPNKRPTPKSLDDIFVEIYSTQDIDQKANH